MSTYTVEDFGGASGEATDNTEAFAKAMSTIQTEGGGELILGQGRYRTGSIALCSNLTLTIESGSGITFIPQASLYPPVESRWEGARGIMHRACLYGKNIEHITLRGGGSIDGSGQPWWQWFRDSALEHPRPYLVSIENSRDIIIEGLTFLNSPAWTLHPLESQNILIRDVTVRNPADSPNTDGLDPESCSDVRILGCMFDVGDDCIAIKAGTEATAEKSPCQNIIISGCNMKHGHGGVVLGSEMSGDIRNVIITGCVFDQTDRGIRLKTRRGRGGTIANIIAGDIVMTDTLCPFVISSYYYCGPSGKDRYVWDKSPYPVDSRTPRYEHIHIHDIRATGVRSVAAFIYGLPEMPIEDLSLENFDISMDPDSEPVEPAMIANAPKLSQSGVFMENTKNCAIRKFSVEGLKTPFFVRNSNNEGLEEDSAH